MRIATQNKKNRLFIALGTILVVIVAGLIAYYFFSKQSDSNTSKNLSNENLVTPESDKVSDTLTDGLPENSIDTKSESVPVNDRFSVLITSFSQVNGSVDATAQTSSAGTCVFTYKPADAGKPVTEQTTSINGQCRSNVSENEFSYIGDWVLMVTFYNNSQKTEAQRNVAIK